MRLKGKVVLITGGGSGLGREMGLLFASEGAKVGVNDVRPEAAQNVMTEIERAGGVARPLVADVSNSAAVKKMFADFLAAFGTVDILVNNAGIGASRDGVGPIPTTEKTDEDWHKMLATHLDATFYTARGAQGDDSEALRADHQPGIDCRYDRATPCGRLLRREGRDYRVHQVGRARSGAARNPRQRDRARLYRYADDRADAG
jgi:NAD(P)-dependent dehydrogenase (short-subunit alcohol dehydrogenase family)